MMSGGWVDVTPRDEMRQRIRDLEASLAAATERAERAESELASATDLANSWARETSVTEARDIWGLRNLIDRLWGTLSGRYFKMQERADKAERELVQTREDLAFAMEHAADSEPNPRWAEIRARLEAVDWAAIDAALAAKEPRS